MRKESSHLAAPLPLRGADGRLMRGTGVGLLAGGSQAVSYERNPMPGLAGGQRVVARI
jgi:hypothetical protein